MCVFFWPHEKKGLPPHITAELSYCFSSLIVILPFFAVSTTLRALVIIPIPSLDSSAAEMVNSFDLVAVVFLCMFLMCWNLNIRPA